MLGTQTLAAATLGSWFNRKDTGAGRHCRGILPLAYYPQDPAPLIANRTQAPGMGRPQAKQLTRQGHSPTYQQTGCLMTPWTQPCPPEGPGPSPTHQCTGTGPGTTRDLQPETLGPSSSKQQADTSPRNPWALALPTSKPPLAFRPASHANGWTPHQWVDTSPRTITAPTAVGGLSPPTSRSAPAQRPAGPQPCPPAGQHKLQNTLDPTASCITSQPQQSAV